MNATSKNTNFVVSVIHTNMRQLERKIEESKALTLVIWLTDLNCRIQSTAKNNGDILSNFLILEHSLINGFFACGFKN